jgi:hypothetical protein
MTDEGFRWLALAAAIIQVPEAGVSAATGVYPERSWLSPYGYYHRYVDSIKQLYAPDARTALKQTGRLQLVLIAAAAIIIIALV